MPFLTPTVIDERDALAADLALKAAALSNVQVGGNAASGRIQSGLSADIAAASLRNGGTLLAGTALTMDVGGGIANTGFVQADAGSKVVAGRLDNAGTWLLSTRSGASDSVTVGGALRNGRSSNHSWIGRPPAPGAADSSPASSSARS